MADPVIDGNLAEVSGLAPLRCSDRVHLFPPDAPWKGPEDLSVEAWFAWNEKGLYFAARVRDDKHCVSGEQPDSVLFSFDWEGWADDGYDENCREVGLADGEGGPYAWMVQKGTEPVPLVPAPVVRRIGSETIYEAFFPWRNLKIPEPKAGKIISANFVVNDNDGSGGKFRMGFAPAAASPECL
ncbi:hypothetical protein SDC9_144606 [bioreactor metagenome]|uniref:Carbohydrate-binding domain-containing protein n=1 Tax=bioreactor metagenome TaxID=1076179 RepID=A0A645E9D9_9ZZZZ